MRFYKRNSDVNLNINVFMVVPVISIMQMPKKYILTVLNGHFNIIIIRKKPKELTNSIKWLNND